MLTREQERLAREAREKFRAIPGSHEWSADELFEWMETLPEEQKVALLLALLDADDD